ncbi:MAG: class I SAM-dependent methyltransferase [Halobacteriales archaeon]
MRRFSAEYLADTRRGFWADREALAALDLERRQRVLDVGCGTGSLADVLRAETDARVVCLDADVSLLREVDAGDRIVGDATRLPVADGTFDLVACQALLVNLPRPVDAVRAFAGASSELVAAVEPDNAAVTVESTVEAEADLAARARAAYLDGLDTDATLGSEVAALFEAAGLRDVTTTRHDLVREVAPPYEPRDVEAARRKATASRLADHEPELRAGGLSAAEYEALLDDWRAMGRAAAEQLRAGEYRRTETVPFYVTVGRV